MRTETKKRLVRWIATVALVVGGGVLIYGPSQQTAKAQETQPQPTAGVEHICGCDTNQCLTCDTNGNCVFACTNPCAPNCINGKCASRVVGVTVSVRDLQNGTASCYSICSNALCKVCNGQRELLQHLPDERRV